MLKFFADYADTNINSVSMATELDMAINEMRGTYDILMMAEHIGLELDRAKLLNAINYKQNAIISLKYAPDSKDFKNILKKEISELRTILKNSTMEAKQHIDELSKASSAAAYVLILWAWTEKTIEEFSEYEDALQVAKSYDKLLSEFKYCGNPYIEKAAQQVERDMNNIYSRYGTGFVDALNLAMPYLSSTALFAELTKAFGGLKGVIIDIAGLLGSIALGSSLSTRLNNSLSVNLSVAIGNTTSKCMRMGEYIPSYSGQMNIVFSKIESLNMMNIWKTNIYAKLWCETKYLGYLQDDRFFMDTDYFLHKKPNSESNATKNIVLLNELLESYVFPISGEEQ